MSWSRVINPIKEATITPRESLQARWCGGGLKLYRFIRLLVRVNDAREVPMFSSLAALIVYSALGCIKDGKK